MLGFSPLSSTPISSLPVATSGQVNYTLTCNAGAYTYSGQVATLTYTPGATTINYTLTCANGSYSYTGVAASLKVAHRLTCNVGAYTYTGIVASLNVAHRLTCAVGAYAYTGVAASLKVVHSLTCNAGSYSYVGKDATLTYSAGSTAYSLACNVGSYAYTGQVATLTYVPGVSSTSYTLSCASGTYIYDNAYVNVGYVVSGYFQDNVVLTYVANRQVGASGFRRQLIVVEIDGKEYRIFADELESFLASMKQEAKDEPVKVSKKTKKVKKAIVRLPEIKIISAPVSIIPQLKAQIERTNVVLYNIMSKAMQRYSDDIEDEELILMML
jgi:hypothetical protein